MADTQDQDEQAMTVRVPRQWHEVLRRRAFDERRPISELVREALREHFGLPPEKEPPRCHA